MKDLAEYNTFIGKLRDITGISAMQPDDDGLVTVGVDERFSVSLQYIAASHRILCFIEVMTIPENAPASVYRDLLVGGLFGQDTAGGFFAVEPESNLLVYNYLFDGNAAQEDPEQFINSLEKMLQLCDVWVDRINGMLRGGDGGSAVSSQGHAGGTGDASKAAHYLDPLMV